MYTKEPTPVGQLVGNVSIQFVHDQDGNQLDAGSGDCHDDVTNGRSEGESVDEGVDCPGHRESIEENRENNSNDDANLQV